MVSNGYTVYDETGGRWLAMATCVGVTVNHRIDSFSPMGLEPATPFKSEALVQWSHPTAWKCGHRFTAKGGDFCKATLPNLLPNNLARHNSVPMEAVIKVYAPEILSDLLELGELGAQPLDLVLDGGPTGLPNLIQWGLNYDDVKVHQTRKKITRGFLFYFCMHFIQNSFHLPPLRFHCVGVCWNRTQDCCDFGIGSQTL